MSQDRLKNVQNLYEERLKHMQGCLQALYYRVMTDEIANTMRENALSHEFLLDRVREIIEEHLRSEKELHIENLMQELAALRSELAGAQQQLRAQAQLPH